MLAAAAASCLAMACKDDGGDDGPIQIALLAPRTGALEFVGSSFARVAEVAVANINDGGGIDGRELVLTVADTATDPATAAAELQRLIDEGVVAIVGPATSGEVEMSYPVARDNRVPIISPSSTAPSLSLSSLNDDGWMFRNVPDDNIQGVAMAYYLGQASPAPIATAHILYEDSPYGEGLRDAFKGSFEDPDIGGDVVDEVAFAQNLEHRCCAASATSCADASCVAATQGCGTADSPVAELPTLCPGPDAIAAIDALAALDPLPETVVMVALEQDAVELVLAWDNGGSPRIPGMQFFMTDGARSSGFLDVAPVSMRGMCGTAPTFPVNGVAYDYLEGVYAAANDGADVGQEVFAPNVWDAFHLFGAAMLYQAQQHPGEPIGGMPLRDALTTVSRPPGQARTAGDWRAIILDIRNGNDIDYDGAAGPNDFDPLGQTIGPYEVWCIAQDGGAFEQALFLDAEDIQAL